MGYDVTFHPISRSELQRYVLDIANAPDLAESRAAEITVAPDKRFALRRIYGAMCTAVTAQSDDVAPHPSRLAAFQFWAAQVAGFLHPYWYARNAAIGFLRDPRVRAHFAPLSPGAGPVLTWIGALPECAPLDDNYSGSGFVEDVGVLEADLHAALTRLHSNPKKRNAEPLLESHALGAVHDALDYCKKNRLGLIEGCDVIVPIIDEWSTDPDNLTDADWHDGEAAAGSLLCFAQPAEGLKNSPLERYLQGQLLLPNDHVSVRDLLGIRRHATIAVRQTYRRRDGIQVPVSALRRMVILPNGKAKPVKIGRIRLRSRCHSHAATWAQHYQDESDYWAECAAEDPTEQIDSAGHFAYGGIVSRLAEHGLTMIYAGQIDLAEQFFASAIRAGEYILKEKLTDEEIYRFWRQRAEIELTLQLARVVRRDDRQSDLDPTALSQVLQCYVKDIDGVSRSDWSHLDERTQSEAIATALLVEDIDTALALLKRKRPADTQVDTRAVFMRCASRPRLCAQDESFVERCQHYLELLRAPSGQVALNTDSLAVPLYAAVLERYVFRPGARVDWGELLEHLGR